MFIRHLSSPYFLMSIIETTENNIYRRQERKWKAKEVIRSQKSDREEESSEFQMEDDGWLLI